MSDHTQLQQSVIKSGRPPSEREKYLYEKPNRAAFYVTAIVSAVLLCGSSIAFALRDPELYPWAFFFGILSVYLLISYAIGISSKGFNFHLHRSLYCPSWIYETSIDILIPICGESSDIVLNTLFYVNRLYPKPNVLVLDDGNDMIVKAKCEEYGFGYFQRPNKGEMKKAGNLLFGLSKCSGEFFVIFDADFAPREDFLMELMPYFSDERTAIVQSPQFFRIDRYQNWVERGSASIQELFYRMIQVSRNNFNAAVCVGTCAIYRRKAFPNGTAQYAHSEDMRTGFMALKNGWRIKYLPVNLSCGKCPDNLKSFFNQQYRWAMGTTSLCVTKEFWSAPISFAQRACYFAGFLYYSVTGIFVVLVPLPSVIIVNFYPHYTVWYSALYTLPSLLFATIGMRLWCRQDWGLSALWARHASYWAHLFALVDKTRGNIMAWTPTGSAVASHKRFNTYSVLSVSWAAICLVGVMSGIIQNGSILNPDFWPSIVGASFNLLVALGPMTPEGQ